MAPVRRSTNVIGVIVGDGAPLLEVAIPPRVFTADTGLPDPPKFEVLTVGERPGPLSTTAGVEICAPHPLAALSRAGIVIVPGWRHPADAPPEAPVIEALRAAYGDGATVVGLCLGAFILAEAGLLDALTATTHWRHTGTLAARFPAVNVVEDVLYVDEGPVVTSAGSAAGLDACLHLIRRDHGAQVANAVARALVVAPHRSGGQAQFIDRPVPQASREDPVGEAMTLALARLDDPNLRIAELAHAGHLSRRTFDRRFKQATGCSPLQWLGAQRVLHAQRLLEATDLDVDAVARRSGFTDAVALRPHFRRRVGLAPHAYRVAFRHS